MNAIDDKSPANAVKALAKTLKQTQGKLTLPQRNALVKAVLKTVETAAPAPSNGKDGKN